MKKEKIHLALGCQTIGSSEKGTYSLSIMNAQDHKAAHEKKRKISFMSLTMHHVL